jgi:hypothetical protein
MWLIVKAVMPGVVMSKPVCALPNAVVLASADKPMQVLTVSQLYTFLETLDEAPVGHLVGI